MYDDWEEEDMGPCECGSYQCDGTCDSHGEAMRDRREYLNWSQHMEDTEVLLCWMKKEKFDLYDLEWMVEELRDREAKKKASTMVIEGYEVTLDEFGIISSIAGQDGREVTVADVSDGYIQIGSYPEENRE